MSGVVAAFSAFISIFVAHDAGPMDMRLSGQTIYATGAIRAGDAAKLAQLVTSNNLASEFDDYVIRLNSPGGLALEGMEIGKVIRDARLEMRVPVDRDH